MTIRRIKVANRADIEPFRVMEVAQAAAERVAAGHDVLHLEVGQPSTGAPSKVIEAAHAALDNSRLGYGMPLGSDQLRERIALHYADWYDISVSPDNVAVNLGASGAFVTAFLACFDVGDRVAVIAPGYPCYRNMLKAFGIDPVIVEVDASTRYQPTPEILDQHLPLDGIVVASPSNPSGTMLGADEMHALGAWCHRNGVRLISDEIYHGITFGQRAVTALASNPEAIVVNSFSKYFSMTGWRLGWAVLPGNVVGAFERLTANSIISATSLSQAAAVAAFDCHDELQENVARYARNREILLNSLPEAGLDRLAPADGAFYVYADVDHLTEDSQQLCTQWLDQLGVAVTPGTDFDPNRGHLTVRFSFAGAEADMVEATQRLSDWWRTR